MRSIAFSMHAVVDLRHLHASYVKGNRCHCYNDTHALCCHKFICLCISCFPPLESDEWCYCSDIEVR